MSTQCKVNVVKDSLNPEFGSRITTFELEYPRIIHSELMTHRVFSRNASSSRAIPVNKIIEQVENKPAMPVRFGKNKSGMQDDGEYLPELGREIWNDASIEAVRNAKAFIEHGFHKQVANRILEPYQYIKVLVTSTCFNNFFHLRDHPDADPTIQQLAKFMSQEYYENYPEELYIGEWHLPYVETKRKDGKQCYYNAEKEEISLEQALKISASCCAQVSYRKLDFSQEKAEDIYKKLVETKPVHASPTEHQATPIKFMNNNPLEYFDIEGVTHFDRNEVPWSGNFHGWVQHRQLIKDNVVQY